MMRIDCDTILGNEEALPREIERLEPIDRTRLDRKVFARPEPTHRPSVESSGRPILGQNDGTRRRRRPEFGRDDLREMRRRKPSCRAQPPMITWIEQFEIGHSLPLRRRSEERRVGKEFVRTWRYRGST